MIFFDIDNTLINHTFAAHKALEAVYVKYNHLININRESFKKVWLNSADILFRQFLNNQLSFIERLESIVITIFPDIGRVLVDEIVEFYLNQYENNWFLYPDVVSCLDKLRGYRLGIISNGSVEQQNAKLKKCGIDDFFDVIIISETYQVAKPDFKIFEIACDEAQILAKECTYIGNNLEHDILPFREYGGHGIWLNRNNILTNPPFSPQVQSLEDIFDLVSSYE